MTNYLENPKWCVEPQRFCHDHIHVRHLLQLLILDVLTVVVYDIIHLFSQPLLDFGVLGQLIAHVGQGVGCGVISGNKDDKSCRDNIKLTQFLGDLVVKLGVLVKLIRLVLILVNVRSGMATNSISYCLPLKRDIDLPGWRANHWMIFVLFSISFSNFLVLFLSS